MRRVVRGKAAIEGGIDTEEKGCGDDDDVQRAGAGSAGEKAQTLGANLIGC